MPPVAHLEAGGHQAPCKSAQAAPKVSVIAMICPFVGIPVDGISEYHRKCRDFDGVSWWLVRLHETTKNPLCQ